MSLSYREDSKTRVVELWLDGRVTREDYDAVAGKLQAFIDSHGTIRLIEVVESFDGFDASVIWPGIQFDFKNLKYISHVAMVSDIGWMGPLAKAAGAVLTTKLRTFDMDELEEARAWAAAGE